LTLFLHLFWALPQQPQPWQWELSLRQVFSSVQSPPHPRCSYRRSLRRRSPRHLRHCYRDPPYPHRYSRPRNSRSWHWPHFVEGHASSPGLSPPLPPPPRPNPSELFVSNPPRIAFSWRQRHSFSSVLHRRVRILHRFRHRCYRSRHCRESHHHFLRCHCRCPNPCWRNVRCSCEVLPEQKKPPQHPL